MNGSDEDRPRSLPIVSGSKITEIAHALASRLNSLPETVMRAAVLKEEIVRVPMSTAAAVLQHFLEKGAKGGPPYHRALLALMELLAMEMLPYSCVREIYEDASRNGYHDLQGALLNSTVAAESETDAVPIASGGPRITLGERKALARRPDRALLDRLARDADPRVIANLLTNPRITEHDVLGIITRRPQNPLVLVQVTRSARWISRYRVKRALVLNPATPVEHALRLLPLLNTQDIKLVAESENLAKPLLETASRLLQR